VGLQRVPPWPGKEGGRGTRGKTFVSRVTLKEKVISYQDKEPTQQKVGVVGEKRK